MSTKFDLNKEFIIAGTPEGEYHCITRGDYENMPATMIAFNWPDEKMQKLADKIGEAFGYQDLLKYLQDAGISQERIKEELDETFWRAVEDEAVSMGMGYYEDLTDEEYNKLVGKEEKPMLSRTAYVTIRIDFEHDSRYIGKDGHEIEDIDAMAAGIVVHNALAHCHTKENGIIIDNIENCGVNY